MDGADVSLYLNESLKVWVALHLLACEIKTIFLLPAIFTVDQETVVELKPKIKQEAID